jgi:hypothetical protein
MPTPQNFFTTDGNPFHPPMVLGYLCEKDDLNERLLFHFNPTSYKFKKSATYDTDLTHNDFVESLYFKYSKALEVTFELFLNEIDQPRRIQRSVEDSIGWLMNRMGPTEKNKKPRGNWLDVAARAAQNGAKQTEPPPALLLVGLRDPFQCVITDVEVESILQRPNALPRSNSSKIRKAVAAFNADSSTSAFTARFDPEVAAAMARGARLQPFPFRRGEGGFLGPSLKKPGDITRAKVNVTLKEFIPSPV